MAENINANVVLTADNQQYNAAMVESSTATNALAGSVDSLYTKIDARRRSMARTATGVGLVGVGTIAAETAAWGLYEKQMKGLAAQSAILSKTQGQQIALLKTYRKAVTDVRSEFGLTTGEAAGLTQQISKITDQTASVNSLTNTFGKMYKATGENVQVLTSATLGLQRVMGTPQRDTQRYTDQLVSLAAASNTSAEGLANFASTIAPMGRQIGLSQTAITGVSKAFIKAGQDGFSAGNAFNKIVSDIAYATSTSSPELRKYSNLIGVTVEEFNKLSGQEKVIQIFDRLTQLGPKAITELNRLGLDGVRYQKAITAAAQSGGGIGASIREAEAAFGSGATDRGAKAASTMFGDLAKMREDMKMTGESLGQVFAPAASSAAKTLSEIARGIREIAEGPIGKVVGMFTGMGTALAFAAAAALKLLPLVVKGAAAYTATRSAASYGLREGFRGAGPIVADRDPVTGQRLGTFTGGGGLRGDQMAAGPSTWFQRGSYNMLNAPGQAIGAAWRGAGEMGWNRAAAGNMGTPGSFLFPTNAAGQPLHGAQRLSAAASAIPYTGAWMLRNMVNPSFDQARFPDVRDRTRWLATQAPGLNPSMVVSQKLTDAAAQAETDRKAAATNTAAAKAGAASHPFGPVVGARVAKAAEEAEKQAAKNLLNAKAAAAADEARVKSSTASTAQTRAATNAIRSMSAGMGQLGKDTTSLGAQIRGTAGQIGRTAGSLAGMGAGALSRGAMGALAWGATNPLVAASVGIPLASMLMSKATDQTQAEYLDYSGAGNKYLQLSGSTESVPGFKPAQHAVKSATMDSTRKVSSLDAIFARSSQYKMSDTALKKMTPSQALTYLAPTWTMYSDNAQARQAAIYDMLAGGLPPNQVQTVVKNLDEGVRGSTESFFESYVKPKGLLERGGTSAEQLGKWAGLALGTAETNAGMVYQQTGSSSRAAQALSRGQLEAFGALKTGAEGFDISWANMAGTDETAESLNVLAKRMLGGVQLKGHQWAAITQNDTSVMPGWATPFLGGDYSGTADYITDFMKSKKTPQDMTDFQVTMLKRVKDTVGDDKEGKAIYATAVEGVLSQIGAASPKNINDPDAIAAAIMEAYTKDADDRKTLMEQVAKAVEGMGAAGEFFAKAIRPGGAIDALASSTSADPTAIRETVEATTASLQGMSATQKQRLLNTFAAGFRDESQTGWQAVQQVKQRVAQEEAVDIAMARTPVDATRIQVGQAVTDLQSADDTPTANAAKAAAPGKIFSLFTAQAQQFKQMILAQKQFDLSVERSHEDLALQQQYMAEDFNRSREHAEADFARQQAWQLQDYGRQRARMEEDYQRSRARGIFDYKLSITRAHEDFNLSRKRQEQDYQHTVTMMVENSARQMMDIYKRVRVEQTNSASWLLVNSADQVDRLQKQTRDLERLRKMGMTDDAIQQLGLTDPDKQQQLARFATEMSSNPEMVKKFNKEVAERLRAAKALVTDESSLEWQEFQRQHKLQIERAKEDFDRSIRRSNADHRRSLNRMAADFRRTLTRMGEDLHTSQERAAEMFALTMERSQENYDIQIDRMTEAHSKQLKRAKQDMDLVARGVAGGVHETFVTATKALRGEQKKMAAAALRDLIDAGAELGGISDDIVAQFWDVFDMPGKPPKWEMPRRGGHPTSGEGRDPDGPSTGGRGGGPGSARAMAAGGVLPGYAPGVDNIRYKSEQGGAPDLHLSGGEAIMVPEWVRAMGGAGAVYEMNRRARNHLGSRFASGGVFWPVPGRQVGTYSGHDGVDINRGSGWDDYGDPIRAFRSGKISYAGSGRGYGDAIFQTGKGYGTVVYGHTSKIYVNDGQSVSAGQLIGRVGNSGNSTAPHLHFGRPGGTYAQALALLNGASGAGWGNVGDAGPTPLKEIIKASYPKLDAAWKDATPHSDSRYPANFWSKKVNQAARGYYQKLKKQWEESVADSEEKWGPVGAAPKGSNQSVVKKAMGQFGWDQWPSLYRLVMAESGFNNTAQNPTSTAYGMFQFLNSTWAGVGGHKTSDPWLQSIYGMRYIKNRYNDPNGAWNFHQKNNWYGDGAVVSGGAQMIGVGERGPEAVIPLNERGLDFMLNIMSKLSPGLEAKNGNVRGSVPMNTHNEYHYQIDRSTTFSGNISVVANNPAELLEQLRAQQRLRALSQPSLGGTR